MSEMLRPTFDTGALVGVWRSNHPSWKIDAHVQTTFIPYCEVYS